MFRWAPSRGGGSNRLAGENPPVRTGRLLHGGVDRNYDVGKNYIRTRGRLLHGGVDRNAKDQLRGVIERIVASFAGAWIETLEEGGVGEESESRFLPGGWEKNPEWRMEEVRRARRLPHGGVDRKTD